MTETVNVRYTGTCSVNYMRHGVHGVQILLLVFIIKDGVSQQQIRNYVHFVNLAKDPSNIHELFTTDNLRRTVRVG